MTGISPSRRPAGFRRVEWEAGDPWRERARWSKAARAYARRMRKPVVVGLIAALEPHLNSKLGYAWVSNETLRTDMGARHVSAIERAMKLADELGMIDREIRRTHDEAGRVISERRIWAAEHGGMAAPTDTERRPRRPSPESHRPPNPDTARNAPRTNNGIGSRDHGAAGAPSPEIRRTLNGSGVNQDSGALHRRNVGSQLWKGGGPSAGVGGATARLIEEFALIGPDCFRDENGEFADLLDIGRRAWTEMRRGAMAASDARIIVDHAKDAVRRSWTDHDPTVAAMLRHLETTCQRMCDPLDHRVSTRPPKAI